ncbi:MAG: choice-of-anchor B family protein [Vicingaceae bacterium]|nr:choice-of-anchor B family protein [Vicingaceae bacterium]
MRNLLLITFILFATMAKAQSSFNMNLVYQWNDSSLPPSAAHDNTYNEIWGYENNGREYAIIGSTMGTHIFDVTDVNNVDTVAFIPGKAQGPSIIHRDYDTYQDYLYIVADEGPSSLQIADLSLLPASAPIVYDSDSMIIRSHNIFIDTITGHLYTCGGATNLGFGKLSIFDLNVNPTDPKLLMNCEFDVPNWNSSVGYLHDIYVRGDTAYCNTGNDLQVIDFSNLSVVSFLGSSSNYIHQGYNHSGWLHSSGDYYALADENHGLKVKIFDVSDLNNISLIDTIGSNINDSLSIPHNLIFNGDNLYVSYYFDGLYVFNTSDPNNISLAGFYDTSTRPHQNNVYEGNWGVYPFLSSGKILASDMQEGLFVFDVTFPTGVDEVENSNDFEFVVFPNPTSNYLTITTTLFDEALNYSIIDINGKKVRGGKLTKAQTTIDIKDVVAGFYTISIIGSEGNVVAKKFIKK